MRTAVWVGLALLAAACEPAPRSESYFVANPKVADEVLEACRLGRKRGDECDHAQASRVDRERKARMEFFQRGVRQGGL